MAGEADGCIFVINLKVTSGQKALETSGSIEQCFSTAGPRPGTGP